MNPCSEQEASQARQVGQVAMKCVAISVGLAYGSTGSYSGQGISFSKFTDIGVEPPDAMPELREVTRTVCRLGYASLT